MTPLLPALSSALALSLAEVLRALTGAAWQVEAMAPPEGMPAPPVQLRSAGPAGWRGPLALGLSLPHATALADQLLGGEGAAADTLAPDAREALRECFLQVLEHLGPALAEPLGEALTFGPPDLQAPAADDGEDPTGLQEAWLLLRRGPFAAPLRLRLPLDPIPAPAPAAPMATGGPSARNLDLLLDVQLPVVVRMGQTEMAMGDLLRLTPGSILELNRSAEAPVDLLVNGRLLARGEVVVVDGSFAFRITDIETRAARLRSLA